jgi:uncharacterized membrane protein YdjX (TVP38/TMEM64 family)
VAFVKRKVGPSGYCRILKRNWKRYWRELDVTSWLRLHACLIILMASAFIAILVLLRLTEPSPLRNWSVLRDVLKSTGVAAPLVFVLIMAVLPLAAPLSILIITGAASFGPFYGMLLSYIGSLLNANLTYFLVKTLSVEELWGKRERTARIKEAIRRRGFHLVILFQMLSVIPFVVINSAAAASGISWRDFMAATMVGVLPAIALNSFLGETVVSKLLPPDFYFAFILLVLLVIIVAALKNRDIRPGRKGMQ